MAPSLSCAKLLVGAISRRGFSAAASQGVLSSVAKGGAAAASRSVAKKKSGGEAAEKVSWVPDPVTGCYRPDSGAKEIDPAELRDMLLKKH